MHQEQFSLHAKEFDDLTKQNQKLFDQWTRVDIECSRTVEDLQITNGQIKQSRNECANLRAEKKIWEVRCLPCLTWSCVSIVCIVYKASWSRTTRRLQWSVPTCRISCLTCRKCITISSVPERMTVVGLKTSYKPLKARRESRVWMTWTS